MGDYSVHVAAGGDPADYDARSPEEWANAEPDSNAGVERVDVA